MKPKRFLGMTAMTWILIGILAVLGFLAWHFWTP